MKFEVRALYKNSMNGVAHVDRECSVPCRDITEEEAKRFMNLLEDMGVKRRETATQIFYTIVSDCRHCTEHIFYK